jgi:hypothetical protein
MKWINRGQPKSVLHASGYYLAALIIIKRYLRK